MSNITIKPGSCNMFNFKGFKEQFFLLGFFLGDCFCLCVYFLSSSSLLSFISCRIHSQIFFLGLISAGLRRVPVREARPAAVRLPRRVGEGEMPHVLPAAR